MATKFSPFREGNESKFHVITLITCTTFQLQLKADCRFLQGAKAACFNYRELRQPFGTKKESGENYINKKFLICILHNILFSG
jgi:hypothetical protein